MTFKKYQKLSRETAIYPDLDKNFTYPTLGLAGETGEVVENIKKIIRDKNRLIDETTKSELSKELGDVLWYLSQLATELNISLDQIAMKNIEKLQSRKKTWSASRKRKPQIINLKNLFKLFISAAKKH